MPPKVQKSKAAKLLAAQSSSKSKSKGKKKTKLREKKNNRVVFTKALYDSATGASGRKARYVTLYTLIEQYKIGGSLARRLVRDLTKAGALKVVSPAGSMSVYAPVATEESA